MASSPARRGFFRNAIEGFINARQRQAQRYVDDVLRSLDRETLADRVRGGSASKKLPE